MIFTIEEKDNRPVYRQLYETIKEEIVRGAFQYGKKLPSKRSMAEQTGVSVITVEHAYDLLQDEGYIESKIKSGYFVIYKASDFYSVGKLNEVETACKGCESVNGTSSFSKENNRIEGDKSAEAAYSEDPVYSVSAFSKTMRKVLLDYGDNLTQRCPSFGDLKLRQEICNYLARSRAMYISPNQVVIGAGAEYLYGLVAQFYKDSEIFAVEWPCYEKIYKVYEAEGHKVEKLNLEKNGIGSEALANIKSKVLHITPFHSYPSGITVDISKKREYLSRMKENGGIIIEDNYDSELTISKKMEDSLFSLANGENVIYINTFSKTIAPNLRAGYMILPEKLVDEFSEKLGFYSCTVPLLEQYFLAEILENGDFERHINRVRRYRRKCKK